MRRMRILLIVVAVVCFGVALSYPIGYRLAQRKNNAELEQLSELRSRAMESETGETPDGGSGDEGAGSAPESEAAAPGDRGTAVPDRTDEAAPDGDAPEETAPAEDTFHEPEPIEADAAPSRTSPPAEEASRPEAVPPRDGASATGEAAREPDAVGRESAVSDDGPGTDASGGDAIPEEGAAPREDVSGKEAPQALPGGDPTGAAAPDEGAAPREDVSEMEAPQALPGGDPTGDAAPAAGSDGPQAAVAAAEPTSRADPASTPGLAELILEGPDPHAWDREAGTGATPAPSPTPAPTPTPDRYVYTGALPYPMKEKGRLDLSAMLPELKEIYALNHDLVGWLRIPDTVIDYPVVQRADSDFYLSHDFYGEENINGQIILDALCDPWTPSYNLIISGHHMKNGSMFGNLPKYATKGYWEKHKLAQFDTLMARGSYVVFAAFYSADYDEEEEGFRYNADIRYAKEAEQWLGEIRDNQLYDTGVDARFGDEFITLTTCNRARHRNGRFVVVCRKIREGEVFE